jgi:hypothetical protein
MKVQIPDQLKSDMPQTVWGKILSATPVVMAVVATMLAGLASSEMTRAQYDRSLGAQQQSKAGDQWGFFQAKRLRGAFQRSTLDLLQNTAELHPLDPAAFRNAVAQLPTPEAKDAEAGKLKADLMAVLDSQAGQDALACLQKGAVPGAIVPLVLDPKLKAATDAIGNSEPDAAVAVLVTQVSAKSVEDSLRAAREQSVAFDAANQPVNRAIDKIEGLLGRCRTAFDAAAIGAPLSRDFTAARVRYTALRYESEAGLNQTIANLYEVQVRESNLTAERHHKRSQRFFFGMLAAQTGVIIATFAIAARKRNLLWSLAAGAGVIAIGFAIYVYLYV